MNSDTKNIGGTLLIVLACVGIILLAVAAPLWL